MFYEIRITFVNGKEQVIKCTASYTMISETIRRIFADNPDNSIKKIEILRFSHNYVMEPKL